MCKAIKNIMFFVVMAILIMGLAAGASAANIYDKVPADLVNPNSPNETPLNLCNIICQDLCYFYGGPNGIDKLNAVLGKPTGTKVSYFESRLVSEETARGKKNKITDTVYKDGTKACFVTWGKDKTGAQYLIALNTKNPKLSFNGVKIGASAAELIKETKANVSGEYIDPAEEYAYDDNHLRLLEPMGSYVKFFFKGGKVVRMAFETAIE